MTQKLESIRVFPADASIELNPIACFRKPFSVGRQSVEQAIDLARSMGSQDSQDDWGRWYYARGFGQGTLYVPFGPDGLVAVSLSSGGEIGDDDISKALFVGAIAYWSQTRKIGFAQTTLRYIMIAQPGGDWYEMRDHPAERGLRNYFCYQEISNDRAQIEQLGSDNIGFFDIKGLGPDNGKFRIDYVGAPFYLDITPIKEELTRRAGAGSVTSLNF